MIVVLSAWGISRSASEAAKLLGVGRAARLVPAYPADGPTILDRPVVPEVPPQAAALLDAASFTRASNAWVIAGSRTRSGKPVLAYETIAEEAAAHGIPVAARALHMVVHGFLHLHGYDHQTEDDAEKMESMERKALARLGLADPYEVDAHV